MKIFQDYKSILQPFLEQYLEEKKKEFSHVNTWADDSFTRLQQFVVQGKMVRGGLVQFAHAMVRENNEDTLKIAAAIELLHSSLLIHDDIIDRDRLRRGSASLFAQYRDLAEQTGKNDTLHYGNSMAICVGDLCYLLAYDLLADISERYRRTVIIFFSSEISKTVFAQMQDIDLGYRNTCTEEDIINIYRFKTARYTFSLPLMLGGILAGQSERIITQLEELGETLGILFQIKDDELGLFADQTKLGKPVGNDIKEGKKTLLWYYLMQAVTEEEKKKLNVIFGNNNVPKKDIEYVRNMIKEKNVSEKIYCKIRALAEESRTLISGLSISETNKQILCDLVEYNCNRSY
jgi:geranylgeranyl diphosphate synthase, type I